MKLLEKIFRKIFVRISISHDFLKGYILNRKALYKCVQQTSPFSSNKVDPFDFVPLLFKKHPIIINHTEEEEYQTITLNPVQ